MEGTENSGDGSISEQFLGAHSYQEDGGGDVGEDSGDQTCEAPLRDQDRFLPIANVARIMKNGIPKSGKVAKDAKECVQECVSEFISFITSEASDRCQQEKRKTINGEDILFAMTSLGFDNYVEPLKQYLQKFRDTQKGEHNKALHMNDGSLIDDITVGADEQFSNTTLAGTLLTQDGQNILYSNQFNQQLNQVQSPF